jgi:AcrR family transcriptional regulator
VALLTQDLIYETAIELADREGFEAVTLRRIAGELGVHVTSLYNYVDTREAITDGIVERLIAEADLPLEPVRWEEWVRRFVTAIGEVAVAHPGAFTALQHRPAQGAQATAASEVALEAFANAGLGPADAYGAVKATAFLALSIGVEKALISRGEAIPPASDQIPESFHYVHLVSSLPDTPESIWAFSVETLVSGLRAQIRRRRVSQ